MDAIRNFASQAKEKAAQFSETHHLPEKAANAKAAVKGGYERTTGRSADVDGVMLKVAAAGAKTSILTATAPAVAAVSGAAKSGRWRGSAVGAYTPLPLLIRARAAPPVRIPSAVSDSVSKRLSGGKAGESSPTA
jgi:hypothetical protein